MRARVCVCASQTDISFRCFCRWRDSWRGTNTNLESLRTRALRLAHARITCCCAILCVPSVADDAVVFISKQKQRDCDNVSDSLTHRWVVYSRRPRAAASCRHRIFLCQFFNFQSSRCSSCSSRHRRRWRLAPSIEHKHSFFVWLRHLHRWKPYYCGRLSLRLQLCRFTFQWRNRFEQRLRCISVAAVTCLDESWNNSLSNGHRRQVVNHMLGRDCRETHFTIEFELKIFNLINERTICVRDDQRPDGFVQKPTTNNSIAGSRGGGGHLVGASRECAVPHLFLKTENNIYVSTHRSARETRATKSRTCVYARARQRQCECVSKRKGSARARPRIGKFTRIQ